MSIEVREISENDAVWLIYDLPRPPERFTWPAEATNALDAHLTAIVGHAPTFLVKILAPTDALAYVTEDDWPGSGIYRVTVTP